MICAGHGFFIIKTLVIKFMGPFIEVWHPVLTELKIPKPRKRQILYSEVLVRVKVLQLVPLEL